MQQLILQANGDDWRLKQKAIYVTWFFVNKRNDVNHLLNIIFEVKPWILLLESTELCQLCVMTVYPEHEIEVDFQIKNKTLKYVNPHLIKA